MQPELKCSGGVCAQATNNYDKDVFNGDAGFVAEIDAKARRVVVEFAPLIQGAGTAMLSVRLIALLRSALVALSYRTVCVNSINIRASLQ